MSDQPISDHSYRLYLGEEKLMGSMCKVCKTRYVPPRPVCIECSGHEMEWVESKGRGKLAAFSVISIGTPAMAALGYGRHNPYCSGVVDLDDGGRVDARIEGVDTKNPKSIQIGLPVSVRFLHQEEGDTKRTFLAFEPA